MGQASEVMAKLSNVFWPGRFENIMGVGGEKVLRTNTNETQRKKGEIARLTDVLKFSPVPSIVAALIALK